MKSLSFFVEFFFTFCIACTCSTLCLADSSGKDVCRNVSIEDCAFSSYQTSIGYWNDNFTELFGNDIKQGKDDYVTASFWVQVAREYEGNWWFFDVYHNILTNKEDNYRTDLLTLRYSIERKIFIGPVRFGTGIIANRNFGGNSIQNGYHKLIGMETVDLPYIEKNRFGIIAFVKYNPTLLSAENIRLKSYLSNSYKAVVGPSYLKAGMEFEYSIRPSRTAGIFHFQTQAGYIDYYHASSLLSPLFERGFTLGLLASAGLIEKYNVSFWITKNQYGKNQSHYGISFCIGWNGSRITELSDVAFP